MARFRHIRFPWKLRGRKLEGRKKEQQKRPLLKESTDIQPLEHEDHEEERYTEEDLKKALDRANKKILGDKSYLGSNAGMVMKSPSEVLAEIESSSPGSKLDILAEMIVTSFRDRRPSKAPEDPDLNDVPFCTAQSELDKKIFFPDWKFRPTWNYVKGHDILGNPCWVFTSKENCKHCFCEMKLRLYRHDSFDHRNQWKDPGYPIEQLNDDQWVKNRIKWG